MNMKENYNYLATWRDLWRDVISMNMKENYNFKGADGDYRPHFLKADNNNSLKNKNDTYGKGN